MKKILLFLNGLLVCVSVMAQPIINDNNTSPVKLSDIVEQYKKNQQARSLQESDDENGNPVLEGKDYHFDRWLWYWRQHLDQDGNIVSPLKNYEEWQNFNKNNSLNRSLAKTTNGNDQWVFEGPDSSGANGSGVGRINVVAFHPTDINTYWVGSPGGGAWKTTNNGLTWTCMTDKNPSLGISDIVINPLNPKTVYLCTGDRDGGDNYSIGILKSYDGGLTWNTAGVQWLPSNLRQANSMVINPLDTNILILAASDCIRKSTDGGATWSTKIGGNFKQVLYNPSDTNILYATSFYNQTSFQSGQIYRSVNAGETWTAVSNFTNAYRIALAVTPADITIVKAVAAKYTDNSLLGIYTSTDTGNTFTTTYTDSCSISSSTPGFRPNLLGNRPKGTDCTYGQGWYDLCIAISPVNANNVYVGGVNTWKSTNGGTSWTTLNQWTGGAPGAIVIHADKHYLKFSPLNTNRLFECNDGGVYWADNPASNGIWNNATNGLGITQFYRVAVSNIATYQVAGAQDNGTKLVQAKKYYDAYGGDGMNSEMDYADSNTFYASLQYGNIARLTLSGNSANISVPGQTGGWVTPYIIEPSCHTCLLIGYQKVYKSKNQGTSWTALSTSNVAASGNLLRVVTTLADSNTIYAIDDANYNIYYTNNGGTTWKTIGSHFSGSPSDIKVDPNNRNHFWVTYSGYNSGRVGEALIDSAGVAHWTSLSLNLPNVPVNCIEIDTSNMLIYIGTDIGVFYKDSTMASWQAYNTGLPAVRINDLNINYTTNEIWAATFGRSLWKSPKQVSTLGISIVPFALNSLTIFPNPSRGSFTIKVGSNMPDKLVEIHMTDLSGRKIWSGNSSLNNNNIQVNTQGLARGTYIVEVSTNDAIIGRNKIVIY